MRLGELIQQFVELRYARPLNSLTPPTYNAIVLNAHSIKVK
jgi:hypothetical protein